MSKAPTKVFLLKARTELPTLHGCEIIYPVLEAGTLAEATPAELPGAWNLEADAGSPYGRVKFMLRTETLHEVFDEVDPPADKEE